MRSSWNCGHTLTSMRVPSCDRSVACRCGHGDGSQVVMRSKPILQAALEVLLGG